MALYGNLCGLSMKLWTIWFSSLLISGINSELTKFWLCTARVPVYETFFHAWLRIVREKLSGAGDGAKEVNNWPKWTRERGLYTFQQPL